MKNLKKLSAAFMLAALLSTSLTSCIDNEVSPVVEAIYANQAELLAAQAAVQNANAEYTDAQAAYQNAMTAYQEELTAYQAEVTANAANVNAQNLLALIATTNLAVATAENSLAIAKANFDIDMAELLAELEAAGADLALGYAEDYADAMNDANDYLSAKLDAQEELAVAQLMLNGDVSWEFALAQLQGDITSQTANKTALEAAIADLEVYMANPTTSEAMVSDLEAQNVALQATIDAKEIESQMLLNEIMAIYEENGVRGDFIDRFEEAKDDLEDAISEKEDKEDDITTLEEEIAALEVVLADYPAAVTAAELAITNADAAVVLADDNVEAAELALVTLNNTLDDKQTELATANTDLDALNADLVDLNASYNDPATGAIVVFALAQATFDSGAAALTAAKASADAALAAGEALVITTDADYVAAKAVFEANPTGNTLLDPGADLLAGDPNDATASYIYVSAVGVYPIANTTMMSTVVPPASPLTGAALSLEAIVDATAGVWNDTAVAGDFYNVEADDSVDTNVNIYNASVTARTAALDAIADLEAAVVTAQDNIDNADTLLADALTAYNEVKDLYENQLAKVVAAEALVAAAVTAEETAQSAVTTADAALVVLEGIADDAALAATAAADALVVLEGCDADCIQESIDDKTAEIAECTAIIAAIQPIIDAKQAVVDAMEVEYEEIIANEGYLSSLDADLHAEIIAKWQARWIIESEVSAIEFQQDLNDDLADAYGSDNLDDLADDLDDLADDLVEAMEAIEEAEVALAEAQVEEAADTAYLTYLQAIIDEAQANYDAASAIAAEYKALMDAALAN